MGPHQDVLEIVPWDPEHVPLEHVLRWAKVEPELSMDTEGGLHGVLFKPPTFILKTSSCYPRDSVFQTQHRCGQPGMGSGEQGPLQALPSHLRSSRGAGAQLRGCRGHLRTQPAPPPAGMRQICGGKLELCVKPFTQTINITSAHNRTFLQHRL